MHDTHEHIFLNDFKLSVLIYTRLEMNELS